MPLFLLGVLILDLELFAINGELRRKDIDDSVNGGTRVVNRVAIIRHFFELLKRVL